MVGREEIEELLKDWRIRIYIGTLLVLGIMPLIFLNLQFGMDFKGGTQLQLKLEKAVDISVMSTMVTILQERLNGLGLKDISVSPAGEQFITVEVSATDPDSVDALKKILSQQGKFEAIIDGRIALYSEDLVQIITNPQQGYGYTSSTGEWNVPFLISKEGSERFAEIAKGKCRKVEGIIECERVYMFIDRPENAVVILPKSLYEEEKVMRVNPENPSSYPIDISEFEKNSLTKIIPADYLDQGIVGQIKNYSKVIVPADSSYDLSLIPTDIEVIKKSKPISGYWLWSATNLRNILFLTQGVTTGEPIREARITGNAPDFADAKKEMTEIEVILRSGRMPVALSVASTSTISPTLGSTFLQDSLLMGIIALFAVAFLVFIRYREPKITGLMMIANISEVIIILGIATIIAWEIDIASVAGIIAAVGTGVDQFIIITDEVKAREIAIEESIVARIKRAFKIIIASAATVTAAMFPLLTLGLGLLKGFAITTLIGIFIGVLIVRPAFGKAVEKLMV